MVYSSLDCGANARFLCKNAHVWIITVAQVEARAQGLVLTDCTFVCPTGGCNLEDMIRS